MAHTKLNTFHLFAGAGGGILADLLLGHNPIGACEIEPYPRNVLLARQRDRFLPNFPIWDDVCTLDGKPWRGSVDVLCGGFPCQDISAAGKGAGITGERSGLWKEYARLIGEMRPRFVFAENSPLLRTRGLGVVLEDLASMGYNARWGIIGARDVGAPHKRDRMWVLAYANELQRNGSDNHAGISAQPETTPELRDCGGAQNLAYTDDNGQATTKESRGIAQRGYSGTSRQEPTSEPSGLCASESDDEMAYSMHKGLQGDQFTGGPNSKGRQEPDGSTSKRSSLWWNTDPAEVAHASEQGLQGHDQQQAKQTEASHGRGSEEHTERSGLWWHTDPANLSNSAMLYAQGRSDGSGQVESRGSNQRKREDGEDRPTEPIVGRVAHGVARRVDRLKAIGNGQVPQCAALAFSILSEGLTSRLVTNA